MATTLFVEQLQKERSMSMKRVLYGLAALPLLTGVALAEPGGGTIPIPAADQGQSAGTNPTPLFYQFIIGALVGGYIWDTLKCTIKGDVGGQGFDGEDGLKKFAACFKPDF
jgi:hypothetical protein